MQLHLLKIRYECVKWFQSNEIHKHLNIHKGCLKMPFLPPVDLDLFLFLLALGVPPPPPPLPIFTPIPWVVSCRCKWAFWRNVWSHKPQQKGLTSSCILMWTTRLYDLEKVLPQISPFSNTQLQVLLLPTFLDEGWARPDVFPVGLRCWASSLLMTVVPEGYNRKWF